MRAIVCGQVGLNKKDYVEAAARCAAEHGESISLHHVGDRMYAEAPDVRPGRILDLPLSRLHAVRRSVFKDIIAEAENETNVIVNTHVTFRWRHGLFRAFDFDQMERLRPDMFICLVDNIDAVHHRLRADHELDASLKDLMVWREEEILALQLLALALDCANQCYVMPHGRDAMTADTCYRLVCHPAVRKAYLSFPMSHVVGMPDVLAEIDAFRAEFARHMVVFDPADVDEKLLLESAIAAAKEGRDFVQGSALDRDHKGTTEFPVSVKQILEIAGDIDGQIYARDFQLIDQSDMIISLVPELAGGVPGLSSGVERELHHAYEHGKEVYVIWKPSRPPSPFITETATRMFASAGEAMDFFRQRGDVKTGSAPVGSRELFDARS